MINGSLKERTEKFQDSNENESTTYHNIWDIGKFLLRGKFIAMSTYI